MASSRTDRGDRMTAHVRDLRQRHAGQAEAGQASTAWRRSRATPSTRRAGTTSYTGAGPRAARTTRSSASSAPAPRAVQVVPEPRRDGQGAVRLPAHAVVDRRPRRLGDRSRVGGQAGSRAGRPSGGRRSITEQPLTGERRSRRCATGSPARRRSAARRTPTSTYMMRIHRRIDEIVEDPATAEALKPWYMFMCKRPCFHNDYLPTFNRPNVHLVDTHGKGITEITAEGPGVRRQGVRARPADLRHRLRGAEDRHLQPIVGEGGVDLQDKYADGIRTLLGIHTHGFPNLFIMGGYQASFQFNLTDVLQAQGDHIADCIDHVRRNGYDDDRLHAGGRGVVGAGGHRQPRQDQPQRRVHARLLQLRGRVQPPPGRQLQRRLRRRTATTSAASRPRWTPTSPSPAVDGRAHRSACGHRSVGGRETAP